MENRNREDVRHHQLVDGTKRRNVEKSKKNQKVQWVEPPSVLVDSRKNVVYTKKRLLGKGGFARVYEVESSDTTQPRLAAKVVMKASLKRTRAREKLKSEIAIHRSLNNERIVGFLSVFEIDKYVVIVLQLARGGTLMDTVKKEKRLSENVARNFAQEILEGIKYLHAERVIHRDLKLGNLMLDENNHVLLGDFGLSTRLSTMEEKKFTLCGTPNYLAPEILSKSRSGHSFTADIFSFGCIIYTLVVGRPPFQSRSVKETYARIRSGTFSWPNDLHVSTALRQLVSWMLSSRPESRPSLNEIAAHPWFVTKRQSLVTRGNAVSGRSPLVDRTNLVHQFNSLRTSKTSKMKDVTSSEVRVPELFILKHLELSKYGFGVLFSNHDVSIVFNDSSKIVSDPYCNFEYIERTRRLRTGVRAPPVRNRYTLTNYPSELKKKVTLLQHFRSLLIKDAPPSKATMRSSNSLVYVKKWVRTRHALLFRISNRTVIVMFFDNSEIILSNEGKTVTYRSRTSQTRECFSLDVVMKSRPDVAKRLKYTKEILHQLISGVRK